MLKFEISGRVYTGLWYTVNLCVSLFQYINGARRSDCRDDRSGFMEVLRCDVRAGEMLGIKVVTVCVKELETFF